MPARGASRTPGLAPGERFSIRFCRHCEERSDEAIQVIEGLWRLPLDCLAALAMTITIRTDRNALWRKGEE